MPNAIDLLKVARSQLGTVERNDGYTRYGAAYESRKKVSGFSRAAWCDMFVGWCAYKSGLLKQVGDYAYTPSHAQWFSDNRRWGRTPKVGAIVFFDWSGSHSISAIDHVGIVEAVRSNGSIVTIEGNTDNAVRRRVRNSGIAGYGYPAYGTGSNGPGTPPNKHPGSSAPRWPGRHITQPPIMSGSDVRTWQKQMRARGWRLDVDGIYGPASESITRAFQSEKHLEVDGVIGPMTWDAAWSMPVT